MFIRIFFSDCQSFDLYRQGNFTPTTGQFSLPLCFFCLTLFYFFLVFGLLLWKFTITFCTLLDLVEKNICRLIPGSFKCEFEGAVPYEYHYIPSSVLVCLICVFYILLVRTIDFILTCHILPYDLFISGEIGCIFHLKGLQTYLYSE